MTKTLLLALALTAAGSARADTVVTLSFDDTLDDQAQVGAMLAAAGVHATFFVNSPRIGQTSYMTMDQVMALQTAGNEIAGHTVNHLSLMTMTMDEQVRQVCNDRAALLNMGFNVTSFAYPHGAEDLPVHSIVTNCGYNSARDASSLRSHDPETCTACAYAETLPPRDPLAIRTPVSIKSTNTLADLQLNVTDAESHGGGWIPFVFHHVCDGCNTLAITPANLQAFITWLAARSSMGTTVKTFQDVIGGPLNPAVPGPAATQYVAPDGNLLHNASLEDDTDGDMIPDCWLVASGGSDTTTYTSARTTDAHTGNSAMSVSVIAGANSSPRLVSFQDLGECAPNAQQGHTYKFSAWYKSADPTVIVAYYRNSLGWWKYWATSPVLAPATDWAQATFTTPAAPAEATAISLGVSLTMSGTLTIDDLRLDDTAGPAIPPSDGGTTDTDGGVVGGGADMAGFDTDGGATASSSSGCSMGAAPPSGAIAMMALLAVALFLMRRRPTR